jgi:hypothetical protein
MRALASAGVFTGIAYAMSGGTHSLTDYALTGAIQGAASLGSDTVHQLVMMYPTKVTASVVTGGLFTAAQHFLRGNDDYVMNYGVSAGSEWAARTGEDMWALKKNAMDAGVEDAEENEEEY